MAWVRAYAVMLFVFGAVLLPLGTPALLTGLVFIVVGMAVWTYLEFVDDERNQ